MKLVSACLAGIKCRYDGQANMNQQVQQLVKAGKAIPVCPEMLAGLGVPRTPCEIRSEGARREVVTEEGEIRTEEFKEGAEMALKIAINNNCEEAILKARSPSCGYREIYDGTFTGETREGSGLLAELLDKAGIPIKTEEDLDE